MSSAGLITDSDNSDNSDNSDYQNDEDNNEVRVNSQPSPVPLPELEESSDDDVEAWEAYRKFRVCFRFCHSFNLIIFILYSQP